MSHEISQLDISGIQLRDSKTQPKVSHSREIGEAQIVHNIFGKAKVRIIRKHDAFWRSLWLAVAFVVAATSTYVLQSWYSALQAESAQIAVPVPGYKNMHESGPKINPESVAAPSVPTAAVIEPAKPAQAEIAKPVVTQKSIPQPQATMKSPENDVNKPAVVQAKPVVIPSKPVAILPKPAAVTPTTMQTVTDGKAQTPAVVAGNAAAKPQAIPPSASKPITPKPPATPVVAAPSVVKVAVPASSPAAAPAQGLPVKEDTSTVPVVGKQLSSPVEPGN